MEKHALASPVITLTTDFGSRDPYVASMKGVIRTLCPNAAIEDLTHDIGPQNITEAALFMAAAAPWFPEQTVHVVVVDPGVGGKRHAALARAGGQFFIFPDNGVLTLLLRDTPLQEARIIQNPAFTTRDVSHTFHGRDMFAPAAARIARGDALTEAGPPLDKLVEIGIPDPVREENTVHGRVIHIDRFGNCITNIPESMLDPSWVWEVAITSHPPHVRRQSYAAVDEGEPLALYSSTGRLEVAVRNGSAHARLGLDIGTPIEVRGHPRAKKSPAETQPMKPLKETNS